jgi:MoaA/NifB/PqqE/SkfB family radical SAM enzyme
MEQRARQIQSMRLEAVVIRADGTREEVGTIAFWHRNPLVRLWHRWARGVNGTFRSAGKKT